MMKIAILTPTYNRANLLADAYKALCLQTNKNFVWYLVDDGSTDNTADVIAEFKKNNEFEIKYIKKENGGKHSALNVGLKQIAEEFFIIVDSDDFLVEDAVDILIKDAEKICDNDEICGIGYLRKYSNGQVIGIPYTQDGIIDTFVNQRYNKNTFGDKCELFKINNQNIGYVSYYLSDFIWVDYFAVFKNFQINNLTK